MSHLCFCNSPQLLQIMENNAVCLLLIIQKVSKKKKPLLHTLLWLPVNVSARREFKTPDKCSEEDLRVHTFRPRRPNSYPTVCFSLLSGASHILPLSLPSSLSQIDTLGWQWCGSEEQLPDLLTCMFACEFHIRYQPGTSCNRPDLPPLSSAYFHSEGLIKINRIVKCIQHMSFFFFLWSPDEGILITLHLWVVTVQD